MKRKCNICGEIKDISTFVRNKNKKYGYDYRCNLCNTILVKQYRQTTKGQATSRAWLKSWLKTPKGRQYRKNGNKRNYNKEYHKSKNIARQKCPDKRGSQRARSALSRLRKSGHAPKWLSNDEIKEIEVLYRWASRLEFTDGIRRQVDHIIPLRGENVSGLHVLSNLQILTRDENNKKGNQYEGQNEVIPNN